MKNNFYYILLLLLFCHSCSRDIEPVDSNIDITTINSVVSGDDEINCFDLDRFDFQKHNLTNAFVYQDKAYFEYNLITQTAIPVFAIDSELNEEMTYANRQLMIYGDDGSIQNYTIVYKGKTSVVETLIGDINLTNLSEGFTGEVIIYSETNQFVEMNSYKDGVLQNTYNSETANACNDQVNFKDGNDGDDCYTIYYTVTQLTNKVTPVDWYNTSGDIYSYIGTSYNYETFPSVFHETFTWCPDGLGTDLIPTGDDGGWTPSIIDYKKCLIAAEKLLNDGFHDPCNPGTPGHQILLDALGGWSGCTSVEDLTAKLNEALGNGSDDEANLSLDELSVLAELPDEIACYIVENKEDDILNVTYILEASELPVIDLVQRIEDCFGAADANGNHIDCNNSINASFNITMYVDQPVPNSRDVYSGSKLNPESVGHTFVSLTRMENNVETTMVFGLYPGDAVSPFDTEAPRQINVDDGHDFDIGIEMDVDCEKFNEILNQAKDIQSDNYDLNDNNCSDFALDLLQLVDGSIPDTKGFWGIGGGTNPGDLGEDLRGFNGMGNIIYSGTAPFSKCN